MNAWYLDTSAAIKLLVVEPESTALAEAVDGFEGRLVGSWLLETEMRRAAHRDNGLEQTDVSSFLANIDLYELQSSTFREAGALAGSSLLSLDALHIVTALRLGVDALVTYDQRMQDSARFAGLEVLHPV